MCADLNALISAAADLYAATGQPQAIAAAAMLRASAGRSTTRSPSRTPPHLASALEAMAPGPLRSLLEIKTARLPWSLTESNVPPAIAGRLASTEIVGPDGLAMAEELRFGLFLQAPETLYPSHFHAAEELYLTLSGTPVWQKDDAPFSAIPPGTLVCHAPYQRLAIRTAADPLLAMWIWLGDLDFASYRFHDGT